MKTSHPTLRALVLLAALSGFSAGCAGHAGSAGSGMAYVKRPLVSADYEQVYLTGSHIPVLVPKDPSIRRIPTISPLVILKVDDVQLPTGSMPFPMH